MTRVFNVIRTIYNGEGRLGVGWGVRHLRLSLNGLKGIEIKYKNEQTAHTRIVPHMRTI